MAPSPNHALATSPPSPRRCVSEMPPPTEPFGWGRHRGQDSYYRRSRPTGRFTRLSPAVRNRSMRRDLRRTVEWCGWLSSAGTAGVLVLRQRGAVGARSAMLVALAPVCGLGAWLGALAGWFTRRWVLFAAALGLSAVHSSRYATDFSLRNRSLPSVGGVVRIFSANVLRGNPDAGALVSLIRHERADIALFQEVGPHELERLEKAGIRSSHQHAVLDGRLGFSGGAVFSRWPIEGGVVDIGGLPMIAAVVTTPRGELEVINVHVTAPLTSDCHAMWEQQLLELAALLADPARPIALVGDFNATLDHVELRSLAAAGASRHAATGGGVGATYPASGIVPPMLRLDHAFVSDELTVVTNSVVKVAGSDHRAISFTLAVMPGGEKEANSSTNAAVGAANA